jgi:flagellar protein FliO/FliZ
MNPNDAGFLSNTFSAQADTYKGLAEVNLGHSVAALLVVLALILLLAWIARRLGLLKNRANEMPAEKILYCCRFNAAQTLIVLEKEKTVMVMVLRGKKLELMAPLPGLAAGRDSASPVHAKPGTTFGALYTRLLKRKESER